jgi:transposase-like protein
MTAPEPRTAEPGPAAGPAPVPPRPGPDPARPGPAAAGPLDEHRPVVDGRPDDRGPAERRADMDELRGELGDTVAELAHRLDVPAQIRAGRDATAARARGQLERVRATLDQKAPPVGRASREQPVLVAAGLLALVALVVRQARRAVR